MRIGYIAAGAGGMYCGSCIHDNTLAAELMRQGHEVALVPMYTPTRTDEANVSRPRVFFGAINVYLQLKSPLFRHTPWFLDRLLDRPGLLRLASKLGASTDAHQLGALTEAMLAGEGGPERKELEKLLRWLRDEYRPDVVQITNSLLLGLVHRIRSEVEVPVAVAVQGEDLFLEQLPVASRERVIERMRSLAREVDVFIAPSRAYADHMAALLRVPGERMRVVPLGIRLEGHGGVGRIGGEGTTIGYLARIAPEKGLHLLVEAFRELGARADAETLRLRIAGYLGPRDRAYFEEIRTRIREWRLEDQVEHVGEVDLAGKIRFLQSLDMLSVPTVYQEPKGLFALEAMANSVPVVLPRHGSFPEMIEATGGGLLVEPDSALHLAEGLARLIDDPDTRRRLGRDGREAVHTRFGAEAMAEATLAVYHELISGP